MLASTSGNTRNNYNPDSNLDNGHTYFHTYGSIVYPNTSQRGLSEPSLLSGLGNINHNVNTDFSNLVSGFGSSSKTLISTSKCNGIMNSGFFSNPANITSTSLLNNGVSSVGLTFDPSDFPPINSTNKSTQNQIFSGNAPHRNYVYAISKGTNSSINTSTSQPSFISSNVQSTSEFSDDHDFPALTVAQFTMPQTQLLTSSSLLTAPSNNLSQSTHMLSSTTNSSLKNNTSHRDHRSHSGGSSYSSTLPGGSLQFLSDHLVANIPKNMICDQFGMLGLVKLIKIGYHDPTFNMLAPGLGLTSLGITNWQMPGEVYSSFLSPCREPYMGRPQDIDFAVPQEYLIRNLISDRLLDPRLDQMSEETLFWLFFNCCKEELQIVAANELFRRQWRFHKKEQTWITRVAGADFSPDHSSEHGVYYYWDPSKAEKMTRQMKICYADLDDSPELVRLSSDTLRASVTQSTGSPIHRSNSTANLTVSQPQPSNHTQSSLLYQAHHQSQIHGHAGTQPSSCVGRNQQQSAQFASPTIGTMNSVNRPQASNSHFARIQLPGSLVNSTTSKSVISESVLSNGPSFLSQKPQSSISNNNNNSNIKHDCAYEKNFPPCSETSEVLSYLQETSVSS